jgi:hypothetical protein
MITSQAMLVLAGLIHLAPTDVPAGSSVSVANPTPQAVPYHVPATSGSLEAVARRGFFVNSTPRYVPQVVQPSVQYVPQVVQPSVQMVQPGVQVVQPNVQTVTPNVQVVQSNVPQVVQSQTMPAPVMQPVVPTQSNMGGPRFVPAVGTFGSQTYYGSFGGYYTNYGSCPNCRR